MKTTWCHFAHAAGDDEVSSVVPIEPDVEYTEVVHPLSVDPVPGLLTFTKWHNPTQVLAQLLVLAVH